MISTTNISVCNIENAIRGMRNPMNSQGQSDSYYEDNEFVGISIYNCCRDFILAIKK